VEFAKIIENETLVGNIRVVDNRDVLVQKTFLGGNSHTEEMRTRTPFSIMRRELWIVQIFNLNFDSV
jgi:hypothetical protein